MDETAVTLIGIDFNLECISCQHDALPVHLRDRALDDAGGDAVDALLALLTTRNALREIRKRPPRTKLQRIEGQVFV